MDNVPQAHEPGGVLMAFGTVTSWLWVGVEWMNDHSGLFVAVAAIVSTGITVMGAIKANKYRKGGGQ